jgi:hypothetical protein
MFTLKPLSKDGIARALAKVERYRLLNEPLEAESICLDVLEVEPANQEALVSLLLAITDQFGAERQGDVARAREILPRLDDEYKRAYYSGIICERRGKSILRRGAVGSGGIVYHWLDQALDWYDKAEQLRPPGNDDAILRWNACARIIERHPNVRPTTEEATPTMLE